MRDGATMAGATLLVLPHAAVLLFLIIASLTRQPIAKGWRHLTPGVGYWLVVGLGAVLSLGIGWVWAFVGSSRSDAQFQMSIAWWLALIFGWGAAWACYRIWRVRQLNLRWRGSTLAFNRPQGEVHLKMQDMVSHKRQFSGLYVFTFKDGTVLPVDATATDGQNLYEKILAENGIGEIVPEH